MYSLQEGLRLWQNRNSSFTCMFRDRDREMGHQHNPPLPPGKGVVLPEKEFVCCPLPYSGCVPFLASDIDGDAPHPRLSSWTTRFAPM